MKPPLETIGVTTLVVCALILTGLVVRHEIFLGAMNGGAAPPKPTFVRNWKELSRGLAGATGAPVSLFEFGDFECPYCAEFHKAIKQVQKQHPKAVSETYIHFPILGHRFAIPAARAAECAGDQGRFDTMQDQLFEHQDDFGLKPWSDFATAAGVPDVDAFDKCVKRTEPIARVEEGKLLGKKLDIQGTPTIIINGWKLGRPPTADELDLMVKAILAGKSPVTANGKFTN